MNENESERKTLVAFTVGSIVGSSIAMGFNAGELMNEKSAEVIADSFNKSWGIIGFKTNKEEVYEVIKAVLSVEDKLKYKPKISYIG